MKKIILIILSLIMSLSSYTQNFHLSIKGLEGISIGEKLNMQIIGLQKIDKHPQYNDFGYRLVDGFRYYYVQANEQGLWLNDTVPLTELFIATTLDNNVLGLFLYASNKSMPEITNSIDNVFGNSKLAASGGEEGATYRFKTLWEKDNIMIIVTSEENAKNIKIVIKPVAKENRGVGPNISID